MKTAISIPDTIYESAEQLASRLGQSRSQLYTLAVSRYLAEHKVDNVTQKLDEVYAALDSQLDAGLAKLQSKALSKDKW
jgi:metal-responsive CopG/Arc/MetJ family transcriptional regulator